MRIPLALQYHQLSKFLHRKSRFLRFNEIPPEWETTFYKEYNRAPVIPLPQPRTLTTPLSEVILKRKTEYHKQKDAITLSDISDLLLYSIGEIAPHEINGRGRRAVASAGARYPLEMYILSLHESNTLPLGVFHYRIRTHELEHIYAVDILKKYTNNLFVLPWAVDYSYCFVITSVFSRTIEKYEEKGYRFVLLEAGAVGQILQHVATTLDASSVIFGGTFDDTIEELIDIDGVTESVVNAVLLR